MFLWFTEALSALAPEIAATTATTAAETAATDAMLTDAAATAGTSALDTLGSGLGSSAAADIAAAGQAGAGALGSIGSSAGIMGADVLPAATAAEALPAAGSAVDASALGSVGNSAGILNPASIHVPTTMESITDPIMQGFNDAYGLTKKAGSGIYDFTKTLGTKMKDNPLLTAGVLQLAKNLKGTQNIAPRQNVANPHPIASNFQPSRVETGQNVYHPIYGAAGGIMNSYAQGGIAAYANGGLDGMGGTGPMSTMDGNQAYPGAHLDTTQFATPSQSPTNFTPMNTGYEVQTDPYMGTPTHMAAGGILAFSAGSKTSSHDDNSVSYLGAPSAWSTNQDSDANTALLDAQEAAAYRQKKLENLVGFANRSKLNPQMALGQVNHTPAALQAQLAAQQAAQGAGQAQAAPQGAPIQEAAGGGIMGHSSLGSYASGGNPRLLKGPGDGMSDNIPAVIANKQPARLADGEFVVPADVVSHLGNGSTDAGAKHLHAMMDNVRKARTGSKKQGKQIDPNKFLPA